MANLLIVQKRDILEDRLALIKYNHFILESLRTASQTRGRSPGFPGKLAFP